jgi:hypothetical protein
MATEKGVYLTMKLVNEDKNGAYLGVRKEFLKEFALVEKNPNFEVYDSKDHRNRFIAAKSSRLPDDDDNGKGRFGINFHRSKPSRDDAKKYHEAIVNKIISRQTLGKFAFAAATPAEYDVKSAIWDKFYTYVWDDKPQTIWVTPHSGNVNRQPDENFPYPKLELDAHVAGATAQCAYRDSGETTKRTMISIHSYNWFSAVLDLGGFGINDVEKLESIAAKIEKKYTEKVQTLAEACRQDYSLKVLRWLEHILKVRGTLHPTKLPPEGIEQEVIKNATKGLNLYKKEIKHFTLEEFKEAINSLRNNKIRVASCNHLFPGQVIGRQLEIADKINRGLLHGALQIEFMKFYLKNDPELIADIILDVKRELFNE